MRRLAPYLKPMTASLRRRQRRLWERRRAEREALESLYVLAPGHLGDALISAPLLAGLPQALPQTRLTAAVHPGLLPRLQALLPAIELRPWMPRWFPGARGAPGAFWTPPRSPGDGLFSVVVDLRGELPSALAQLRVPARWRIGLDEFGTGAFYDRAATLRPDRPQGESQLAALRLIAPALAPAERLTWSARRPRAGLLGLAPGAGCESKTWPPASWRALIPLLRDQGWRLRLLGAAGEVPELAALVDDDRRGRGDAGRALDLIADCEALVAMDSFAAHAGAALGRPTLVLFGAANDPRRWAPRGPAPRHIHVIARAPACAGCRRRVCEHKLCLTEIRPAEVADRVARDLVRKVPLRERRQL